MDMELNYKITDIDDPPDGIKVFKGDPTPACVQENAVGFENLSVQTHHNIVLSQCDLKTRLKHAKITVNDQCDEKMAPKDISPDARSLPSTVPATPKDISPDARSLPSTVPATPNESEIPLKKKEKASEIDEDILQWSPPSPKTLSTQIREWIRESSITKYTPPVNDSFEERRILDGSQPNQIFQEQNLVDDVSNPEDFLECSNEDITAGFSNQPSTSAGTVFIDPIKHDKTSLKRKNSTPEQFSKRQRVDSGQDREISENDTSNFVIKNCYVALNKIPDKEIEMHKNEAGNLVSLDNIKECYVALKRMPEIESLVNLPSSATIKECYVVLKKMPKIERLVSSTISAPIKECFVLLKRMPDVDEFAKKLSRF